MTPPIYLDHNATTPILPEVAQAMAALNGVDAAIGNPASQHGFGRRARKVLEDDREGIAEILGANLESAQADQLIFTSGGTEANNLALFGLPGDEPGRIIVSAVEHPSVMEPAKRLARQGWDVATLGVGSQGGVESEQLHEFVTPATRLISVMLGNNETGAIQPIEQIVAECRDPRSKFRGLIHTDAIQVAGKLPLNFRALGVDAMSIAAHKFHGPRGIGALILRHGVKLTPRLFGGHQQAGLRPGTEPVALAAGMYAALLAWRKESTERSARLAWLRDRLEESLIAGWPNIVVHSGHAPRLPHTLCVSFPGLNRQSLVMALDMAGVACSTGSACSSGSTDPSPTLVAMGCGGDVLQGSIRLSLGATTTKEEVNEAASRILKTCQELQPAATTGKIPVAARRGG